MGMWDTPLPEVEKKPVDSGPPDTETHVLGNVADSVKASAKYLANSVNNGFWNFVGNVTEATKAAGKEPLPVSAARVFFGTELVDAVGISPYSNALQMDRDAAALEGKYKPTKSTKDKIKERFTTEMEAPGPISGILGRGAEFAADPANLVGGPQGAAMKSIPFLSKSVVRPAITAFGAGAGAETGRMAGGPIAAMTMGEESRGTGEAVGSIVGAVAGGNVNDVRVNALKTAVDIPVNAAKAASAAVKAKRAGDEKNLLTLFADNYGDLSSKSKGILTEHIRSQFADAISRDPQAQASLREFEDAIAKSGGPSDAPWNLGQRATTPVLVEEIRLRVPASRVEAEQLGAADMATKADVASRFKSLVGRTVGDNRQEVVDSLDNLRRETNLKLDALASEGQQVTDGIAHWDLPGTPKAAEKGTELRALADEEVAATRTLAEQKYSQAIATADAMGVAITPDALRAQGGEILGTLLSQIDPKTAPGSVRRLMSIIKPELGESAQRIQQLQDMLLSADGPGKLKINQEISALRRAAKEAEKQPLTMKDLNDINVALSVDRKTIAASGTPDAAITARNIGQMQDALEGVVRTQLPAAVRGSYDDARAFFREVHAPRSKEGANLNIRRQAGSARAGEERVVDEQVFNEYLKPTELETRMGQFDNLFGGKLPGTVPNPKAYALLGEALEDKYYRELLSKQSLTPEGHLAFLRKYNSALERLPETAKKLDDTFTRLMALEGQKLAQVQRWKEISSHDLTKTLGVDGAKEVMTKALADPAKMQQLMNYTVAAQGEKGIQPLVKYVMDLANPMTGGQYDPKKLMVLANAGKSSGDRVSPLQMLFRRAYGEKAGNQHFDNLQAIATLAERQAATTPEFLRPAGTADLDPIRGATGQSGASYLTMANAAAQGRVSGLWATAVSGGRFLNMKLSDAMRKLQYEALFDPQASAAVLEMAKTRVDRPLAYGAAKEFTSRMGEGGASFLRRLVDTGAVRPITLQSARIGTVNATKEIDEEKK